MLLYHLTTIFTSLHSPFHHLLSFTQCLFQNRVSSTYSVTITTQLINFKCYHSHKLPLLRVYASFHQKLTLLVSNRNTGLVHHLSTNHSTLGPLGNHSEAYGMDVNCPLGHLSSYYSVSTSLLTNRSNSLEYCTTTIILLWIISHIQWWINRINYRMNRINYRMNRINYRINKIT